MLTGCVASGGTDMKKDRERVNDRREGFVSPELPFLQDHGLAIAQERRHHPDRRLNGINVGRIDAHGKD